MKREDLIENLIWKYYSAQHDYLKDNSDYYRGLMDAYKDTLSILAFDTKLLLSESYKRIFLLRGNMI